MVYMEMNKYIQKTEVPKWMTKGKTTPIKKGPFKETTSSNYRTTTYLPTMWKILTAQIRKKVYYSFISQLIFLGEKKIP